MCVIARHHYGQPRWANVYENDGPHALLRNERWHISPILADNAAKGDPSRRIARIKLRLKARPADYSNPRTYPDSWR
jgi:hypothetical protein